MKNLVQELSVNIINLLKSFRFKEVDSLVFNHFRLLSEEKKGIVFEKYEKEKAKYIGEFLSKTFSLKYGFDSEQLEAIASICKNILVTARAGSGKTKIIIGKIGYLIKGESISPNKIIALSFNQKAAQEIEERIKGKILDGDNFLLSDFHYGVL